MKQIIIRQTGPNSQPRFSINAAGDTLQIAVHDMDAGTIEVIFTGDKFSEKKYQERGIENEKNHFSHYKKQPVQIPA